MNNDDLQQIISYGLFVIYFVSLTLYARYVGLFFKQMEILEPEYYELNGEPLLYGFSVSSQSMGSIFLLGLMFKLPDNFPDNELLVGMAKKIQKYQRLLLLIPLFLIMSEIFLR